MSDRYFTGLVFPPDEAGGADIFDGNAERLINCFGIGWQRLRTGQQFSEFGVDGRVGRNDFGGFAFSGGALFDDDSRVPHDCVIEFAVDETDCAYRINMNARFKPFAADERLL